MESAPVESPEWVSLGSEVESLRKQISGHSAATVGKQLTRDQAKSVVQRYFRGARPQLVILGFSDSELAPLDELMQELLRLANGVNAKSAYTKVLKDSKKFLSQIEATREMRLGLSNNSTSGVGSGDALS